MSRTTRRRFLASVGSGAGTLALGALLAEPLAGSPAFAAFLRERLRFGALDPLVDLMQATPADELLARVVALLREGTPADELVAAAALANARALGGTDYNGYHALMALLPAQAMGARMEPRLRHLPLLKVLHRNARFVHAAGHATSDAIAPVEPAADGPAMAAHARAGDLDAAERSLAALAASSPEAARAAIQELVREEGNVHRVVLAWRAIDLLRLAGERHAETLLRQSLRFCFIEDAGRRKRDGGPPALATFVPRLLEEHRLEEREPGTRRADDATLEQLARTIFASDGAAAAAAAAGALAEGTAPEDVGAAISLAATLLLLHEPGRARGDGDKPVGSIHGASVGVHASDAANAWRCLARAGGRRDRFASLIAGAGHTGGQKRHVGELPFDHGGAPCTLADPDALLRELDARVRAKDQAGASLVARRYAELGHPAEALFAALLPFAVEDDGALHHEKFFHTATEEHAAARAVHRPLYAAALARVLASGRGFAAPGLAEARALLLA